MYCPSHPRRNYFVDRSTQLAQLVTPNLTILAHCHVNIVPWRCNVFLFIRQWAIGFRLGARHCFLPALVCWSKFFQLVVSGLWWFVSFCGDGFLSHIIANLRFKGGIPLQNFSLPLHGKKKHFKTIIKIVPRHVKAKVSKHSYRNVSGSQKRGKIDVAKCIKEGQMVVAMPKNWHEINDMKKRVKMTEGTHQTMKETSAWMKLN